MLFRSLPAALFTALPSSVSRSAVSTLTICITAMLYAASCACAQTTDAKPSQDVDVEETSDESEARPEYVRIRRNERRAAVALETSVIHFGKSSDYPQATVDLIGAIHLGEPEYYRTLNRLFAEYDSVLFEAVMPKKAVERGLRPGGAGRRVGLDADQEWTEAKVGLQAIGILQIGMQDVLGLEFQLSEINYAARNFVHADMTQEEFEASMKDRGESFSEILAREMGRAAVKQQEVNPIAQNLDLVMSILASDRKYRLRRIAAVQLTEANEGTAFAGADGTSTIITERNGKAMEVLKKELRRGQRKVAIFYGAGHFVDMEQRLIDDFDLTRLSEKWVTAWHLKKPETSRPAQ